MTKRNCTLSLIYISLVLGMAQQGVTDPDMSYYEAYPQWTTPEEHVRYGPHEVGLYEGDLILSVFVPVHARNPEAITGERSSSFNFHSAEKTLYL